MNHKKKTGILMGISAITLGVSLLTYNLNLGAEVDSYAGFIGLFAASSFIFLIALLFLNPIILKNWLRFALIFIPIAAILTIISPEYSGCIFLCPEKGSTIFWTLILFLLISIGIILWKSWKLRKQNQPQPPKTA